MQKLNELKGALKKAMGAAWQATPPSKDGLCDIFVKRKNGKCTPVAFALTKGEAEFIICAHNNVDFLIELIENFEAAGGA